MTEAKLYQKYITKNGIQGPNTTYGNVAESPRRKIITPSVLNILTLNALVLILSDQNLSSIGAFLLEE
jgi:hypothetical protein